MAQKKIEENGVWRTIGGRRIFIADGEDLATAMKKSGKFGNNNKDKSDNEKLANELVNFVKDYDIYEFRNAYDDEEDAVKDTLKDLDNGNTKDTIDWLQDIVDNDEDEEIVKKAKELIDKVNNKDSAKAKENKNATEKEKALYLINNGGMIGHERGVRNYFKYSSIGDGGFISPNGFVGDSGNKEFVLARKYKDGAYLIEKAKIDKRYKGDVKQALKDEAGYQITFNHFIDDKWKIKGQDD